MRIRKKALGYEEPSRMKKRYYSFLTIILLFCAFIVSCSVLLNINKIISYQGKIIKMKKIQTETAEINSSLKRQLEDLNSRSYEAIARNNLKMSGENEVLVIVRDDNELEETEQNQEKSSQKKKNKEKKKKEKIKIGEKKD